MTSLSRPLPGLTGPGRRAQWRRSVLRRVVAALCVAAAALVGLRAVRPPPAPTAAVVQAVRDVPAGAVLAASDLGVTRMPVDVAPPGALSQVEAGVGRRLGSGLAAHEPLTSTRLVPRSVAEGLPPGTVGLHVLLADPAAADLLSPGVRVVLFPTTGGTALARDVGVLAVDPVPVAPGGPLDPGSANPARGVVLAVPPAAAEAVLAGHGGLDGPPVVNVAATG